MMTKPHKHAELIKAWADNQDIAIQWRRHGEEWIDCTPPPSWEEKNEYRLKPESPKYPQTRMTNAEMQAAANPTQGLLEYGPRWMEEARNLVNAAIARAVQDGDVYLPAADGDVVLLSDHIGRRIFMVDGEEHVPVKVLIDAGFAHMVSGEPGCLGYVNKWMAPNMVPAAMLWTVAKKVRSAAINAAGTLGQVSRISTMDIDAIIASVRKEG